MPLAGGFFLLLEKISLDKLRQIDDTYYVMMMKRHKRKAPVRVAIRNREEINEQLEYTAALFLRLSRWTAVAISILTIWGCYQ